MRSRAACLALAPVLLLVTTLVAPANEDDAARQLAVVAAHRTRWFVADTLVLLALAAHRAGRMAAPAAAALTAGAILTALGYAVSNDALPVAGAALLALALTPVGLREWRAAQAAAISS